MQFPRVYLLMGLSTLACQKPDHQPPVEPTAQESSSLARSVAEAPRGTPSRLADTRCIVPMPEQPLPQATAAAQCPADLDGAIDLERGQVTFDDTPSRPKIEVELARADATRQRGLMYRRKLDSESGMLFMWDSEVPRTFWMRDTCIPLDMLFIAKDRTIAGVLEQVPTLNDIPRGVPCKAAYVLEVNAGWTRAHKVEPGQHVSVSLP